MCLWECNNLLENIYNLQGIELHVEMTFVVRMGSVCQRAKCVMAAETALMGPMNKSPAVSSVSVVFKEVFLKW